MNTPYFLISENELSRNICEFKCALNKHWPCSALAYSVKTNSLPWLLKYMNTHNVMGEVVSDEEYQLVKLCGFTDKNIVFNGPIKGVEQLDEAINAGAIINIDSLKELDYIKKCKPDNIVNIGIRVNVNTSIFKANDIGYVEDGFRFGFSEENGSLEDVIMLIRSVYGNCRFGLHLHCNSVTRSLDVYRSIASYASDIIQKYKLRPSFIDMGGGFFGGVEGKPTADEYISIIKSELKNVVDVNNTKLIIEPGTAIVGSTVELYTSVIDVKRTAYSRIITTDGSRIHIDPLWKKDRYMYLLQTNTEQRPVVKKQIICGYTCMDHDRIMSITDESELKVGDVIVYKRVGAYSMTFGGPFIRYFPDVYVKYDNEVKHVRKRMTVEDYFKIQTSMDRDLSEVDCND